MQIYVPISQTATEREYMKVYKAETKTGFSEFSAEYIWKLGLNQASYEFIDINKYAVNI